MDTMTPDREIRALARALGCERREVVQALEAAELLKSERRPAPKLQRQAAPFKLGQSPRIEKRAYVRSAALMKAYRLIPCQNCGTDDGTVCGAHSNWAVHGKGKSIKADDNRCASLCSTCHGKLDQGSRLSEYERKALWWGANVHTFEELQKRGLWPKDVPEPDFSVHPFHGEEACPE
jgi:hypothetical protein